MSEESSCCRECGYTLENEGGFVYCLNRECSRFASVKILNLNKLVSSQSSNYKEGHSNG